MDFFSQAPAVGSYYYDVLTAWSLFAVISLFISLLFMVLILYCFVQLRRVRAFETKRFETAAHTVAAKDVSKTQLRWNRVQEQINSENDQGWRLAILEADIMLNELLDVRGYRGETMADKMRQVERADFNTIDLAWEGHRARNRVAHEGTQLSLNQREARRVVGLYEQVFKEFQFVE